MTQNLFFDFFRGNGQKRKERVVIKNHVMSDQVLLAQTAPEGYRLGGLSGGSTIAAVNVALVLRSAILVSGEPGSGKTQLAFAIAHELGRDQPLKFVCKSTSRAQDLLYTYDAVQHFRASQAKAAADVREYIQYSPLGLAILLALPLKDRVQFLPTSVFDTSKDKGLSDNRISTLKRLRAKEAQQTVVLIDEIDKAPRDFPNDLLDEIENLTFKILELGGIETPRPVSALRPIVIITTNSERPLPDAFLRRCVFTHLTYPAGPELEEILSSRLNGVLAAGSPLLRDISAFYEATRAAKVLDKDPGVSELIQFIQIVACMGADPNVVISGQREIILRGIGVLAKSQNDVDRVSSLIMGWSGRP